ncbi:MAG: bifunctional 3-hydroxydecanoyl-ACP dehydratase/trans-2-decenoyl-ACP isomerase [bacterium]|nr:bifunctional 3-hydroxydecanoyl-ACP dehydratase/trans-2-decenoyl-ACP isomerase [bacterium]
MKYDEFCQRDHFDQEEVLALGHGTLIEDPPDGFVTRLPIPPMLMIDRVTHISRKGNKGAMTAERDVRLDDWFFQCHFRGDPVQPGCLGVDAVWQMLGMYCAWNGGIGGGRALGVGEVDFGGEIRPYNKVVRYEVKIVRFVSLPASGASIVIGDASVLVDDEEIYTLKRAKVGVFRGIDYPDYPKHSPNSIGGKTTE